MKLYHSTVRRSSQLLYSTPVPHSAASLPACDCLSFFRPVHHFVSSTRVPPAVVECYTDPRLAAASVERHLAEEDAAGRALYWSVHLDGQHLLVG